ncbi:YaaC family protein [Streptomyces sp. NPDC052042]|uniref:YaaC family protein n=1 Tax=Streptomyces sp. NPDC052042 TaxID=3365683 RepID=UPI0037CD01B4
MHSDLDADEAWERLRASRSDPPARANTGARRKTYSAALEQAQQLFQAAAVVGPATRPVLVFYGLSQAGRAIAAAAWSLKGEDWRLDEIGVGTHEHSLLSIPVCGIPDRVIDAGTREALDDFLTAYPNVAQHESYVTNRALSQGPAALPDYTRYDHGGGELVMNWLMPQGVGTGFDGMATSAERLAHLRAMTRGYAGERYFLPLLPRMKRELHPLMAWWAVLYTLSMLARYEPAVWGKLISVDDSPHSVPIERLLERAINHLPVLIADTITEVST